MLLLPESISIPFGLLPAESGSVAIGQAIRNDSLITVMPYITAALYLVAGYGVLKKRLWALWLSGILLLLLLWLVLILVLEK